MSFPNTSNQPRSPLKRALIGDWADDLVTGRVSLTDYAFDIFGLTPETFDPPTFENWTRVLHPDDRAMVVQAALQSKMVGAPLDLEFRIITPAGEERLVHARADVERDANGRPRRLIGSTEDITQRRAAELEIQRSQALFRMASRLGRLGAWRLDLFPARKLIWSDEVRAIHEVPADFTPTLDEAIGFYAPESRAALERAVGRCISAGVPFDLEAQLITAKQRLIWVRAIGEAVRAPDGAVQRIQGAFQDISDQRWAQERIEEQARLLDIAHDGILVRDLFDRIIYWNKGAERIYGYAPSEALGKSAVILLHADQKAYQLATAALLANGEWQGEFQKRTKDGRERNIEVRWTLVRDAEGNPKSILAINTDVTERRQLEAHFLRAQRMESVGTLAGGIAHDLNNILAPILMSLELLRMKLRGDADGLALVDTLLRSGRRGSDLVRQVLAFSRGVQGERIPVNAYHIAREIQKIARETFPKNISFEVLNKSAACVLGDPTQIHQVLMNLCVNARDAMPGGGVIRVTLENTTVDEVFASLNPEAKAGPYVLMTVSDTGAGIPAAIRDKIFEPFFTTKEVGSGTGLGLSTSLAIIRSHGGFIQVDSEAGKGSRFRVYLTATALAEGEPSGGRAQQLPRGRGEMILVIDDEEPVRAVAKRTLEAHGYQVALAANGAEGISTYATLREEIALVITDMAMPVLDGSSTIIALRALNPALRIIASSGLSIAKDLGSDLAMHQIAFVPKPYTAAELLEAIARCLQAP